jgi:hypothetical protein
LSPPELGGKILGMENESEAPPITCTVNLQDFAGLLADMVLTAGVDIGILSLDAVGFHAAKVGDKDVIVATSCNRYILGQAHIEFDGIFATALMRVADVKRLASALKKVGKFDAILRIEAHVDQFIFSCREFNLNVDVAFGQTLEIPSIDSLFKGRKQVPDRNVSTLGDRWLTILAAIGKRRKKGVQMTFNGASGNVTVAIGSQYRASIKAISMPEDANPIAPVFELPARG